jgi:hypothetical protein
MVEGDGVENWPHVNPWAAVLYRHGMEGRDYRVCTDGMLQIYRDLLYMVQYLLYRV